MWQDAAESEFQWGSCLQFSKACISSTTFPLKTKLTTVNQVLATEHLIINLKDQICTFCYTIKELCVHRPKIKQITVKSTVQIICRDDCILVLTHMIKHGKLRELVRPFFVLVFGDGIGLVLFDWQEPKSQIIQNFIMINTVLHNLVNYRSLILFVSESLPFYFMFWMVIIIFVWMIIIFLFFVFFHKTACFLI